MTVNVNKIDSLKGEPTAALALAAGASYRGAADVAGVTARTIARRMDDQVYQRHVQALRAEMLSNASGRLARLTLRAAIRLGELLDSENDQVVLGAARAILDQAGRYRELVELSERIARLEELVNTSAGVTTLRRRS